MNEQALLEEDGKHVAPSNDYSFEGYNIQEEFKGEELDNPYLKDEAASKEPKKDLA